MENIKSNKIWNKYYEEYEMGSDIPGVKYPNEHLVRYMMQLKKEMNYSTNDRPKVLEFGFGNITNMLMMSNLGFDVIGVEVSQDAVDRARRALKQKKLKTNVEVMTYAGGEIPFSDNEFDIIVGLQCVYYNLDQKKFANECSRVTKNNGLIFLSFFSDRHGYMDYIDGDPGSIVRFNEKHPHKRLIDLKLFLYKDREQFQETYGVDFDIDVGLYETDQLPIFQSWYYLRGQKKNSDKKILFPHSSKELINYEMDDNCKINENEILQNNINIWEEFHDSLPKDVLFNNQQYPNEDTVRFLATFKRRRSDNYFDLRKGQEDQIDQVDNLKVLEINPLNPIHLMVMNELNYQPFAVTTSSIVKNECERTINHYELTDKVNLDEWDGKKTNYNDNFFDTVISHKYAYNCPSQKTFIEEVSRILKKDGEVFMWYLTPYHGYNKHLVSLGNNYYRFSESHPNKKLVGLIVYIANEEDMKKSWEDHFDVEIKYFEFDMYKTFSSFYLLYGIKK